MHKLMGAVLLCGALTGCAGMNSDFDCNKTATDQCLSMADANKLAARGKSLDDLSTDKTPVKKPATETLPVLGNSKPAVSPYRPITSTPSTTTSGGMLAPRPVQGTRLTTGSSLTVNRPAGTSTLATSLIPVASRPATPSNTAGQVAAVRVPDATQRLWIAPWVDTQDNFHQPAVVEFVKDKSHWDDSFRVIGEGGE